MQGQKQAEVATVQELFCGLGSENLPSWCACCRSAPAGKPGTKREAGDGVAAAAAEAAADDGGATAPNKRSKARQPEDAGMTDAGLQAAAAAAAPAGDRPHFTDEHTVFVKGLGFDVKEEDLQRLFAELGVKSVRIGRDRVTGASRVSAGSSWDALAY
ncbi:hypothetical protein COO60DRAFT_35320 [Scenedesmus sp. NREL 46B-D3]|nr:hypothetical protein COO60DRAFT_35320 [Scenedesmus sp. NREL 46B-D3]